MFRVLNINELDNFSNVLQTAFNRALEEYHAPENPSGLILQDISEVILNVSQYEILRGSSYIAL